MERDSFIFYKEYKEALNDLNNDEKLEFYECITNYALYGIMPTQMSTIIKSMFNLIKDKLEKNNRSYFNFEERRSSKYKKWKKDVLERDLFTCQKCGHIGNLVVHHIKSFADNMELRFDVNNGITLCQNCHKEVHKNER